MKFEEIIKALTLWRNQDHEDNIILCRNEVVEILEGIKELSKVDYYLTFR